MTFKCKKKIARQKKAIFYPDEKSAYFKTLKIPEKYLFTSKIIDDYKYNTKKAGLFNLIGEF
jgi:hypothetical protein